MPDRQAFAGSVATADRLIRVMTEQAGLSLHEAVRMISLNPARLLKLDADMGSIREGKLADLIVFNEKVDVRRVYVGGREMSIA